MTATGEHSIVAERVFCVADGCGDVDPDRGEHAEAHGLYAEDTRHLSRWVLSLAGARLTPLSAHYGASWARLVLVPPAGRHDGPDVTVHRDRFVGADGFVEELSLVSHRPEPVTVDLRLEVDADFADLYEVRGLIPARTRDVRRTAGGTGIRLCYGRGSFDAGTTVTAATADGTAATAGPDGLRWQVTLPPHGQWTTRVTARCDAEVSNAEGRDAAFGGPGIDAAIAAERDRTAALTLSAPTLHTDWPDLEQCWRRSLDDLAALTIGAPGRADLRVPAAGLPWFMTLFGRDSLLTAWFALPYLPQLARDTLRALAGLQGTVADPGREEQPGKIPHELRTGELTVCGDLPFGRYYGTVDATPLFGCLLDEYHRWTGDDDLVHELAPYARAAVQWMNDNADDGGYLTYLAQNPRGLANQCWKDSPPSIAHIDGSLATGPIAVCEAQGYAYDAYRRVARLSRTVWDDHAYADALERRAAALAERFAVDFWMPDRDYVALALDGDGRQVGSLTSNPGHLLFSGILGAEPAARVAERLVSPELFSGWGLRTMATGEAAYHPVTYHNGSVWPHDTAIAAAGLARYGFRSEAAALAEALVQAAGTFDYRLPEVFAGYARSRTGVPVRYPTACSPQAWAAATPLLLVTTLLGRTPDSDGSEPPGDDPALPDGVRELRLGR